MSNVAAAAFAPFISAAGPGMFGFDGYTELAKPRDLAKIFETSDYAKWRSFRDNEDARFVSLVMPPTLARLGPMARRPRKSRNSATKKPPTT